MFWQLLSLPSDATFFVEVRNGFVPAPSLSFAFYFIAFFGLILAIVIHEFAHAWSAHLLGDDTAKYSGRITLNPFAHFDIYGFALILLTSFGYGKPVPVNPNNFKNPVQGMMYVSLAGPVSNFLQAVVCAMLFLALKQLPAQEDLLTTITYTLPTIGVINLSLMVFNMLPIPPLDGSKIWGYLSPAVDDFIRYKIAPNAFIIIILLIVPIFGFSILGMILQPFANIYLRILGS